MKKLILLIMALLITSTAWSASEWDKTRPLATDRKILYPTAVNANNEALDRLLSQYPKGITLSYSSATTIVASTGGVVCSNSLGTIRKFRNNTSTTNITFADIDAGAEAGSATYYVWASCDADAETATFKISLSATAPTGITSYKRIGSFYNDSSSDIDESLIYNDNRPRIEIDDDVDLNGKTIANGFIGKTTTGSSANFNSGTTITAPTGCYIIGGYKQGDGNFITWNYACP